jgi:hypothetical protein
MKEAGDSKTGLEWFVEGGQRNKVSTDVAIYIIFHPKLKSLTISVGRPSFGFSQDVQPKEAIRWCKEFHLDRSATEMARKVEDEVLRLAASYIMET